MNILHINTERTWRGGEQQTLYLLQGLIKRQLNSHLVCQPDSPLARAAATVGVTVFPLRMRGEIDFFAAYQLRKLLRKYPYDTIHCHTSHAHTLAFLASWGTTVRRLVTRRVDFSILRHSFLKLSGIKYRYMADYYIAISRKIKEVLVSDGIAAERIFVVHSGIDPDRFSAESSKELISEFAIKDDEGRHQCCPSGRSQRTDIPGSINTRGSGAVSPDAFFHCGRRGVDGGVESPGRLDGVGR